MLLAVGVLGLRVTTLLLYSPWSAAGSAPVLALVTAGEVETGVVVAVTATFVVAA